MTTGEWHEFTIAVDTSPGLPTSLELLERLQEEAERVTTIFDPVCSIDQDGVVGMDFQIEAFSGALALLKGVEIFHTILYRAGLNGPISVGHMSVELADDDVDNGDLTTAKLSREE